MTHRSINKTILSAFIAMACASVPISDALAKKGGGGGGNAGGGNGGDPEPVYTAAGDLIDLAAIDSTNLSFDDIIFRPSAGFQLDLGGFNLDNCSNFGWTTGTLVLTSGDSAAPEGSAELRFGFQGSLTNGKSAQYFLIMNGVMDTAWPPTAATTTMGFDGWEIAAENRKDQRNDCEGAGDVDAAFTIYQSSP